ncbi:MAG: hypothetical protein GC154_16565 [bacterium]|nr:hypothetical protein [bacterium]
MAAKGCCTEWEQELVLYGDGELAKDGSERVERHLHKCQECSSFYNEMVREENLISGALRRQAAPFAPRDAFSESVMMALEARSPETVWTRLQNYLHELTVVTYVRTRPHMAAAISLLICLAGALIAPQINTPSEDHYIHVTRNGKVFRVSLLEPIHVWNAEGEFFELPDGSILYATAGTWFSLEAFQEGGGAASVGSDRLISLKSGELFVDVRPAKEAFSILTTNSRTTVFGTQFYVGVQVGVDKHTTVGVRQGRVIVEKQARNQLGSTVLTDGEETHVISRNSKVTLSAPDTIDPELLARLNRFYDARSDRTMQRLEPNLPAIEGEIIPAAADSLETALIPSAT